MKNFLFPLMLVCSILTGFSQKSPIDVKTKSPFQKAMEDRKKPSDDIHKKSPLRIASTNSIHDSMYYWQWDIPGGTWGNTLVKILYSFDSIYNKIGEEFFIKRSYGWRRAMLTQYTYDSNHNIISQLYQDWDTVSLTYINGSFNFSSYDSNSNLLQITYQQWNGSGWDNLDRYSYTYDSSDNRTSFTRESGLTGVWVYTMRQLYNYDSSNNCLTESAETWSGTGWDNGALITWTYDINNNVTSELRQNWSGAAWNNQNYISYTYDISNNMISYNEQYWGGTSWTNYLLDSCTYDINNNRLTFKVSDWNGVTWKDNYIQIFTYDTNNNQTSYLTQNWDTLSGTGWHNNSVLLSTYDSNSNLTEYSAYYWGATGWVGQIDYTYNYDIANNLVSEVHQNWNGSAWENVDSTHNYYRIRFFVWPGDANNDFIVDNYDLLPIGLYYGTSGFTRPVIGNVWQADSCTDWAATQINGADLKHADCNGDGTIDANDTLAINLNFSLAHSIVANNNDARLSSPNLYIIAPGSFYYPGDWVDAEIWLGTSTNPVSSLYGIAFNINYDANLVQPGTESMTFNSSWLGAPGTNALKISKVDAPSSTLYAAETRINHTNASGYGKIATFRFQVKTSLMAPDSLGLNISGYTAVDASGNPQTFNTIPLTLDLVGVEDIEKENGITIFPNPYYNQTEINYLLNNAADVHIEVFNSIGQKIETLLNEKQSSGNYKCLFSAQEKGYNPGIYFVKISIDGNSKTMKIVELK